jgi:hypothetical protein
LRLLVPATSGEAGSGITQPCLAFRVGCLPRFFAVSSIRNGRTWYNRCNRANEYMNCVLINYPAVEERLWDAVVTRISLSLAN